MSKENLNIEVKVADRVYQVKAKDSVEHANILAGEAALKEKLEDLYNSYKAKDEQEYLAMVALTLSIDNYKMNQNVQNVASSLDEVNYLDNLLTDFIATEANS